MSNTARTNLVLVEIILVVLFFSLSAVTILRVFAAAYVKTENNREQTHALMAVQDMLESFAAADVAPDRFFAESGWSTAPDNRYRLALDADFRPDPSGQGDYFAQAELRAVAQPAGTLYELDLSIWRAATEQAEARLIGSMPSAAYVPNGEVGA